MIKDLKLSKLKTLAVQVDDVLIDNKFVKEFITDIEIESNYFRGYVNANMTCEGDLFTLSVCKSPEALKDTRITFYFEDEFENNYTKQFFVVKSVKRRLTSSKNLWTIVLIDAYGKCLLSLENNDKITSKGYTGKPLEIVENAVKDLMESDEYEDCNIKFIRNDNIFIDDNNITISHRFVKDKTPIDNITTFCSLYNIHIYQDDDTLYFIQNPKLKRDEALKNYDGTALYSETCKNNYYGFKICDKIKQNSSLDNLNMVNYIISLNEIGKKHEYKYLYFKDFLTLILLNDNILDFKIYSLVDKTAFLRSTVSTLSSLAYSNFIKYIKANTLVIYCRSTFPKAKVGCIVSVDMRSDARFANERSKGDVRYNGNWLITSSTIKIVNDMIFYRLKLNRYDNQDEFNKEANLISDGNVDQKGFSVTESLSKREELLSQARNKDN